MSKLLVSNIGQSRYYEEVRYRFSSGEIYPSRISTLALAKHFASSISFGIILVPSTLNQDDITTISEDMHDSLNIPYRIFQLPIGGLVGDMQHFHTPKETFTASSLGIFSTIEQMIQQEMRPEGLILDLTHSPNNSIITLLLAGMTVAKAYDLNLEAFVAPILGRPQKNALVEFQDITPLIKTYSITQSISSCRRVDERELAQTIKNLDKKDMFDVLGGQHKEYVLNLLNTIAESVWKLRIGLVPQYLESICKLRKAVDEGKRMLQSYTTSTLDKMSVTNDLGRERDRELELTELVLVSGMINVAGWLVDSSTDIKNILLLYKNQEYYENIYRMLSELLVAELLRARGVMECEINPLDGEWKRAADDLAGRAINDKDEVERSIHRLNSKIREKRNKIAHAGMEKGTLLNTSDIQFSRAKDIKKFDLENDMKEIIAAFLELRETHK